MHLPVSIISDVVTVIYSGESRSENPKLEIKIFITIEINTYTCNLKEIFFFCN